MMPDDAPHAKAKVTQIVMSDGRLQAEINNVAGTLTSRISLTALMSVGAVLGLIPFVGTIARDALNGAYLIWTYFETAESYINMFEGFSARMHAAERSFDGTINKLGPVRELHIHRPRVGSPLFALGRASSRRLRPRTRRAAKSRRRYPEPYPYPSLEMTGLRRYPLPHPLPHPPFRRGGAAHTDLRRGRIVLSDDECSQKIADVVHDLLNKVRVHLSNLKS